jgi:hypothetical protein
MKASRNQDRSKKVGVEPMTPIEGTYELGVFKAAGLSKGACDDCAEILHGLNNVLASMLLNAQVMEWKLPSYSRSRRYIHEIERNAQRGGELVKRLLERLDAEGKVGRPVTQVREEISVMAEFDRSLPPRVPDAAMPEEAFPPAAGADPASDLVEAP